MGISTRRLHPADRGLVLLSAWVEPALREYVRTRAHEAGVPVSEWVGKALMKAVQQTNLGAFCFPEQDAHPEEDPT